ncbi:MAG: CheB methylesterase [Rhizobacter sp.]|nr:CheB methylesterase [Rhizobacter sp.]
MEVSEMAATSEAIVVLGASAGGVESLVTIVSALPADLKAAVFVVLHIPPHTRSGLAQVLQRTASMPVAAAVNGEPIRAGQVYVALADRHLTLRDGKVQLTRGPKECRSRPAIDVLFRTAATEAGPRVIGVVLTGMLDDGTAGLWSIKESGGIALVEDPRTARYPGMPQSAMNHVAVDAALPVEALAAEIVRRVQGMKPPSSWKPTRAQEIETTIALEGNGLKAGVMKLGSVSKYTCPDCHGVLVQIEEGSIVRFRCHTGHAFSAMTLLAEVNESIDKGLWDTLRAVEERILLLRQLSDLATASGNHEEAAQIDRQAEQAEVRVKALRELVMDPKLFGHDSAE